MKKCLLTSLLALLAFVGKAQEDNSDLVKVGDTMPSFTIVSDNGSKLQSASLKGKVILVNFFATWCPPCQKELASNIHTDTESTLLVDYSGLIMEDSFLYDNSTIMLLNLLKKVDVAQVSLAGFDGLRENEENYVDDTFPNQPSDVNIVKTNKEVRRLLEQYKNKVAGKIGINFLTPSIYETS